MAFVGQVWTQARDDLSIPDLSPLVFRSVFALHDPLDAERTFFHDPFLPDSHVRIELPVQGFRPGEGKPVEATNLVGTVFENKRTCQYSGCIPDY